MARALVLLLLVGSALGPAAAAVTPGTSTAQNPQAIFATPGAKQVTLQACNALGCSTVTKTVTVLNPMPVIDQATVGALQVTAGQPVSLTGAAHGRPPLTYTWKLVSLGPEIDLAGASASWNTSGVGFGTYLVSLVVQNSAGTASSLPVPLVVSPRPGFYTLTACRALDTRLGSPLANNGQLVFPIAGAAGCAVPPTATAVAVNLTVVAPTSSGSIAVYPGNLSLPAIATINFSAGRTLANNAVLGLATDGSGTLAATASLSAGATADLLVDVVGYFQ
jgi:hypothetical protein